MIDRTRLLALKDFERLIRYRFRDRNLLNQALTHRSYAYEHPRGRICDNERLEFLGDAILGLAISDYIYRHFPEYQEGRMTRIKSLIVSRMTLEEFARRIGVGRLLILGKGEAANGGAEQPTNLVGAYEAVVGAIYLDGGFKKVNSFIETQFKSRIKNVSENGITKDYKSILQEHTSKIYKSTPLYRVVLEEGPDHKKHFEVDVSFGGMVRGRGEGKNKKTAEASAAYEALLNCGLLDNSNHKT